jgi:predicted dehydrogenase
LEDYGSVLLHFDNGASGAATMSQLCAGRKCTIDWQLYGSKAALAWNHERPELLWQGERDKACEVLRESPLMQDAATSRFARLPSGHPMGYFDTLFNLFRDFYATVEARTKGKKLNLGVPDFEVGFNQMQIIEAVLKSNSSKKWVKIK